MSVSHVGLEHACTSRGLPGELGGWGWGRGGRRAVKLEAAGGGAGTDLSSSVCAIPSGGLTPAPMLEAGQGRARQGRQSLSVVCGRHGPLLQAPEL